MPVMLLFHILMIFSIIYKLRMVQGNSAQWQSEELQENYMNKYLKQ